jgi:hypothetical protein
MGLVLEISVDHSVYGDTQTVTMVYAMRNFEWNFSQIRYVFSDVVVHYPDGLHTGN